MAHITYTHTINLPDGTTAEHTAEALGYRIGLPPGHPAGASSGVVSVLAACCGMVGGILCEQCNGIGCAGCGHRGVTPVKGMEDTRSWHSFYDTGMQMSDGNGGVLPPVNPAAELARHVQSVAERHAARHRAGVSNLDALVRPKSSPLPPLLTGKAGE